MVPAPVLKCPDAGVPFVNGRRVSAGNVAVLDLPQGRSQLSPQLCCRFGFMLGPMIVSANRMSAALADFVSSGALPCKQPLL
jgi:hypothetical protein